MSLSKDLLSIVVTGALASPLLLTGCTSVGVGAASLVPAAGLSGASVGSAAPAAGAVSTSDSEDHASWRRWSKSE